MGLFKMLRVSSLLTPIRAKSKKVRKHLEVEEYGFKKYFFLSQFCLVTSRIGVVSPPPPPRHVCFKVTRCLTESRIAPAQCLVGPDSL